MAATKWLLLIGGGHAHLHVLARLAAQAIPDTRVTLVSPSPLHHYSGMVPGYLQGTYAESDLTIDLAALCARLRRRIDALAGGAVTIVGGGAGGVEVALAVYRRLACGRATVTLVEASTDVLSDFAPRVRRRARAILVRRGVAVRTGAAVIRVEKGAVHLAAGGTIASDLTIWLAGAAPPDVVAMSPLPHDAEGYLLVDASLRAVDGSPVWGAGDCITLAGEPRLAKAGVYAVREAPALDHNLRAALAGTTPRPYRPQHTFLALLNTADGKALARWRRLSSHSRAAWWLKDWIDCRFVGRYQALTRSRPRP